MTLRVDIGINEYKTSVTITNIGHPRTGDHPDNDDLRSYMIECPELPGIATVQHRKCEGSWRLIALVMLKLDAIRVAESEE